MDHRRPFIHPPTARLSAFDSSSDVIPSLAWLLLLPSFFICCYSSLDRGSSCSRDLRSRAPRILVCVSPGGPVFHRSIIYSALSILHTLRLWDLYLCSRRRLVSFFLLRCFQYSSHASLPWSWDTHLHCSLFVSSEASSRVQREGRCYIVWKCILYCKLMLLLTFFWFGFFATLLTFLFLFSSGICSGYHTRARPPPYSVWVAPFYPR